MRTTDFVWPFESNERHPRQRATPFRKRATLATESMTCSTSVDYVGEPVRT